MPADATGVHADLVPGSPETAAVAVRYVSGMTDRYALGLGVELLGWRPEAPPARRVNGPRPPASRRSLHRWASSTRTWQRVREATDLVALAGEHIALKRVGRRFSGLCPFHTEKSPSFSISPEKDVFYCFGCQKSGDAITFVREVEHLDFVEAVERLAARAGHHAPLRRRVVLQGAQAQAAAARSGRRGDRVLPRAAARVAPTRATRARYLRSRGFDGDVGAAVLARLRRPTATTR